MSQINSLLEKSKIEIHDDIPSQFQFTHAIFDHDGTLSVLRRGWEEVMSSFMFNTIANNKCQDEMMIENIKMEIKNFIEHTTGIRTLEQMDGLIGMVKKYGFVANDKIVDRFQYKKMYLDALMKNVNKNILSVQSQNKTAQDFLIKGSYQFLKAIKLNFKEVYLASGTDEKDVRKEATLLGIHSYFNGGVFGARDECDYDIKTFVMEQISNKIGSENMKNTLVVGDGPVEIREGKKSGAFTIGIASNEAQLGGVDLEKRTRLIKAGAHIIIGDYLEIDKILKLLQLKIGVNGNAI